MFTRRVLIRVGLSLLAFVCAAFVLFVGTMRFGLITGEEFAPDTFQRRSYYYYELPLVRLKITPVTRDVHQYPLEAMLAANEYIVARTPPRRWALVACHRGGELWLHRDAQILCRYLDAPDGDKVGKRFWQDWTVEHSSLAKVLWPEIAVLARRMHYLLIPHVFAEALEHERPERLRRAMNRVLAHRYNVLAAAEAKLGNFERGIRLYGHALTYQPGHVSSLDGRATCYKELGRHVEAARDRKQLLLGVEQ